MTAYLDWAATAPPDPEISGIASEKAKQRWANPSSLHEAGRAARESLEAARAECAHALDVPARTLFFTSGGTEADHIPLLSLLNRPAPASAVVSAIEHPAIANQAKVLKRFGWKIIEASPDENGIVRPETVAAAIREDTALVSVMAVNNETGAIQPVAEIASAVAAAAKRRVHFHTDAVQAAGKTPLSLGNTAINSAAFSAHKLGGARGIGLLYCNSPLEPLNAGGGQEGGMRPGTENLYGAWSMAAALKKAVCRLADAEETERVADVAAALFRQVTAVKGVAPLPPSRVESDGRFSPFIFQFTNEELPGEVLARALSDKGVFVSTGSACSSKRKTRPVLAAMRTPRQQAANAFRVSIGRETTMQDVAMLAEALDQVLAEAR